MCIMDLSPNQDNLTHILNKLSEDEVSSYLLSKFDFFIWIFKNQVYLKINYLITG